MAATPRPRRKIYEFCITYHFGYLSGVIAHKVLRTVTRREAPSALLPEAQVVAEQEGGRATQTVRLDVDILRIDGQLFLGGI